MAIKKIIKYPSTSLRTPCVPVEFGDNWYWKTEFLEHLQDLRDTLAATPNGLALASNQIRPEGWQVFVVRCGDFITLPEVVINPHWFVKEENDLLREITTEGCLSIPELNEPIERYTNITLDYYTQDGVHSSLIPQNNMAARVVQHEVEHLNGGSLVTHLSKKKQVALLSAVIKNRKAGR